MSKPRDDVPPLLTIDEVAAILNVSKRHVRRLIKTGKLAFHRVGIRAVRIAPAALDNYLKATNGSRS